MGRKKIAEQMLRFQMVWPAELAARVEAAADARTLSVSAWIRQAILNQLEREEGEP